MYWILAMLFNNLNEMIFYPLHSIKGRKRRRKKMKNQTRNKLYVHIHINFVSESDHNIFLFVFALWIVIRFIISFIFLLFFVFVLLFFLLCCAVSFQNVPLKFRLINSARYLSADMTIKLLCCFCCCSSVAISLSLSSFLIILSTTVSSLDINSSECIWAECARAFFSFFFMINAN